MKKLLKEDEVVVEEKKTFQWEESGTIENLAEVIDFSQAKNIPLTELKSWNEMDDPFFSSLVEPPETNETNEKVEEGKKKTVRVRSPRYKVDVSLLFGSHKTGHYIRKKNSKMKEKVRFSHKRVFGNESS
jgi:hypothetical protein